MKLINRSWLQRPILLLLRLVLLLLAVLTVQIILVSASIGLAKSSGDLNTDNAWLQVAKTLSYSNPDVAELEARALRSSAANHWGSQEVAQAYLERSLLSWQQAISLRPQWPYYRLAAFDIEVLMSADDAVIQRRFDEIVTLAPNERGMDRVLLELALFSWPQLLQPQKNWVIARLAIVPRYTLKALYLSAKTVGREQLLCTFLPWGQVKHLCLN
ncbi:MAG: hypothetical protein JKY50_12120 [Oleispira sp.]|nr:hypothetical protein [Oleispira sp.]